MNVTVAITGCGNISRFDFSGFEKAVAQVKWVCDLNEAAARPCIPSYMPIAGRALNVSSVTCQ